VGTDFAQTLTNKTLDNTTTLTIKDTLFTVQDNADATKQMVLELSGITTGNTRTLTVPNATTTLLGLSDVATQANQETATSLITVVTPGRQHFHPGHCKLWAIWDNNGSSGTNIANYSLTSITDAGLGLSVMNFATTFSAATYCNVYGPSDLPGDADIAWNSCKASTSAGKTTTALRITSNTGSFGSAAVADLNENCVAIFGDL
jgi:hypothetical protein